MRHKMNDTDPKKVEKIIEAIFNYEDGSCLWDDDVDVDELYAKVQVLIDREREDLTKESAGVNL